MEKKLEKCEYDATWVCMLYNNYYPDGLCSNGEWMLWNNILDEHNGDFIPRIFWVCCGH